MKDCPEAREKVLAMLRMGNAYSQSASAAGISAMTLSRWRKADSDFDEQCHAAEAEGIRVIEDVILNTAKSAEDKSLAFQAAKFIVERRKPTRGDYAPVSHNHPFLAIQHNYMNPLAQFAPNPISPKQLDKPTVVEGEIVDSAA